MCNSFNSLKLETHFYKQLLAQHACGIVQIGGSLDRQMIPPQLYSQIKSTAEKIPVITVCSGKKYGLSLHLRGQYQEHADTSGISDWAWTSQNCICRRKKRCLVHDGETADIFRSVERAWNCA